MSSGVPPSSHDRVIERRAVALARHFREAEGLSIRLIAYRLTWSIAPRKTAVSRPSEIVKPIAS